MHNASHDGSVSRGVKKSGSYMGLCRLGSPSSGPDVVLVEESMSCIAIGNGDECWDA